MSTKLLEIENIEVKYGAITALKKVSLSVRAGEIVSLIGANGAGKTTLLKSIVGLEPLTDGEIRYEGDVIARGWKGQNQPDAKVFGKAFRFTGRRHKEGHLSTDRIVSRGISLVPEGRRVFSDMTVQENLEMGAFRVRDEEAIRQKMEEMFDLFPILRDRRKQKTGSLSGGEQQMLAIARALMSSPRLLLLDEPGLGLAPLIIRDIFDIIVRINQEENVTVFLVEQNARMALNVSQKGYVMETGSIVMEDESAKLLDNAKVKAAYLGE